MAVLSTHTLNSVDGSHAGGIALSPSRIEPDGRRTQVLNSATDAGGRFSEEISLSETDTKATFELVLQTGAYFEANGATATPMQICRETVIRFQMPDAAARYHIPMMLAPNSHSVWWSGS
ncbi:MAG: hydroxyisourate hydrolase [Alphaproteobacteria bacterium]|nr:hydroxyisourate hydrolase [Alphaproteobacteria bacterium]